MMLAVPELLPEIVEVFVSVPRTQDPFRHSAAEQEQKVCSLWGALPC